MRVVILSCVLSYLVISGAGAAASEPPQEHFTLKRLTATTKKPKDEALNRTIEHVRTSFMERDTGKLADFFGESKVYLSLKSRPNETGYYTKSQLQFIFNRMFKDLRTRSFECSSRDIGIPDENRAHFRSEWTYVALGSDTVVTEHLRFSLVKEKGDWRISEIKASSR